MTSPDNARPLLVGPDTLQFPFPVQLRGEVIKGFGRGSRELGIPTANFPTQVVTDSCSPDRLRNGIYFGWAQVRPQNHKELESPGTVHPMVMSLGWNPYYKNIHRSAEVHLIHEFAQDFYGDQLRVLVAGYIRDEKDYAGVDALIADIKLDIKAALHSLQRDSYLALKHDAIFVS